MKITGPEIANLPVRPLALRHESTSYITPERNVVYDAKRCKYLAVASGRLDDRGLFIVDAPE